MNSQKNTLSALLLENMDDGILVVDLEDIIVDVNSAMLEILEKTENAVIGQPLENALPALRNLLGRYQPADHYQFEWQVDEHYFQVRVMPLRNPENAVMGRLIICHDVTDVIRIAEALKGFYEQLSDIDSLKKDVLLAASHGLRNPLSAVLGYLELLRSDIFESLPSDQQIYFDNIEANVRRIAQIVEELMSVERIEELADTYALVDLLPLVELVVAEYQPQATRRLQILRVDAAPILVMGNNALLRESVANLVSNALKYTPEGGEIDVSLHVDGEFAVFQVADNGLGIPDDQQGDVFKPFYRGSGTQHIQGTGLGLYVVKKVVERHKGQLIFKSVYQEGSTIGFRLPLAATDANDLT